MVHDQEIAKLNLAQGEAASYQISRRRNQFSRFGFWTDVFESERDQSWREIRQGDVYIRQICSRGKMLSEIID